MLVLGLMLALVLGLVAGWLLRPLLEARLQRSMPGLSGLAAVTGGTVAGRLDATIAEIESQLRQGIDRDRNGTRLQILREVKDGD